MRALILAALTACCLSACVSSETNPAESPTTVVERAAQPGLTQNYAAFRSTQIANVRYRLHVDLDAALEFYTGTNTMSFDWLGDASALTVDFTDGDVRSVRVNGETIAADYNKLFITVPPEHLQGGRNEIAIEFTHAWSDNGSGLYRYDDPDDGNVYLYTDFEPYDANYAFPLVDQPDIKATFTLSVTAPTDWQVITTDRATSIGANTGSHRTWTFPETPLIPTYIMSLHAGPYAVWEDGKYRIPLRLFARQSMADLVAADASMWFQYTRDGFDFFEDYYSVDYPFRKYDQLLVPDFNAGAMENAGAVTFTERAFIQRDGWSYKERKTLATVIWHEMAHMWFGNLVTMRWWNDLWLNETFATFMAHHAAVSLGFEDAWQGFFLDQKYYAYWLDRRRTTHPVEVPIPDTYAARTNFDSISYSKGGSVLRQIEFQLGPDVFRQGIRRYLQRHAFANSTLADLVAALSETAGRDLGSWAEQWLGTAGVNTIEASFDCVAGTVTEFALLQSAPDDFPILRTQKIQLALLRDIDGVVVTDHVLPVTYSGSVTRVPAAVGLACPDLVYPNYGDMGYLLVRLDARTRANLDAMIGRVNNSFQRAMFWQTLWDNVRYAQIPVTDYLDAVFAGAAEEDDINNVDQVYAFVGTAIKYLRAMQTKGAAALAAYRPQAEAVTWANVERTRGDLQTMYLDRYLAFASSAAALERFVDLLTGVTSIPNRELDRDRRWWMLRTLSGEGHPRTAELLALESARDKTDDGRRAALRVEAATPDLAVKRRFIADVADRDSRTPLALQRLAMGALFPFGQEQLHEALADDIFAQILANEKDTDPAYYSRAIAFAAYLVPTGCDNDSVDRLRQAMHAHEQSRAAIRDLMIERYEDSVLCVERAELISPSAD